MLKVEMVNYEDLTESQQMGAPDNGSGKDRANYLRISHNGEVIAVESDAMEPEDVNFYRDLSWIAPLLRRVYVLGLSQPM